MKRLLVVLVALALIVPCAIPVSAESSQSVTMTYIHEFFDAAFSNYDYYKLTYNRSGIIVEIALEGFTAQANELRNNGFDETAAEWVAVRENCHKAYQLCSSYVEILSGTENFNVTLMMVDDAKPDDILLAICNGVVIFDIMATY